MSAAGSFIIEREKEFLTFLKSRYPLFHLSNVFFRDLQYGVMAYLEQNKLKHDYPSSEDIAREIVEHLEHQGVFRRMDGKTWLLQYPDFKAVSKKPPAAKPAAARPAASPARPAAAPVKPAAGTPAPASPAGTTPPPQQGGTTPASAASPPQAQTSEGPSPA